MPGASRGQRRSNLREVEKKFPRRAQLRWHSPPGQAPWRDIGHADAGGTGRRPGLLSSAILLATDLRNMPLFVYVGHRLLACLLTAKIRSRINVICPVQPCSQKYTCFRLPQISAITSAVSSPQRGAYRDRHGRRDGMRWTRQRWARNPDRRAGVKPVSDHGAADERR